MSTNTMNDDIREGVKETEMGPSQIIPTARVPDFGPPTDISGLETEVNALHTESKSIGLQAGATVGTQYHGIGVSSSWGLSVEESRSAIYRTVVNYTRPDRILFLDILSFYPLFYISLQTTFFIISVHIQRTIRVVILRLSSDPKLLLLKYS